MATWYLERRLADIGTIDHARDLACHLHTRQLVGRAMIIADEPFILLRLVRKEWLKTLRSLQRERSSTLDCELIQELTRELALMQCLHFVAGGPKNFPEADVFFVRPEMATALPPSVHTVYICTNVEDILPQQLTEGLKGEYVFVDYTDSFAVKG